MNMRIGVSIVILVLILLTSSCEKDITNGSLPHSNDSLVVNEIMALNGSTIHDEYGECDDWIELYNASTDTCIPQLAEAVLKNYPDRFGNFLQA